MPYAGCSCRVFIGKLYVIATLPSVISGACHTRKTASAGAFSPDIAPLFVHFRADDDVTARLYARGYRLRPGSF